MMCRRAFLTGAAALAAGQALGAPAVRAAGGARAHVVVVGGGFAGATAAKYLRLWSGGALDVSLVEPNAAYVSCPMSNLVIGGSKGMADITIPYDALAARWGVRLVRDVAAGIDAERRRLTLASGEALAWDRLVVAPGIDFLWDQLPGLQAPGAREAIPHAWKAGPQTLALRRQLEAMPDGGVFAIAIPQTPFRCPPAPYERATQAAFYLARHKPKSKVLILDANEEIASKPALFRQAWQMLYPGMVEYRPGFAAADVDAATRTVITEFGDEARADVLNLIPPQRAGDIAQRAGLANLNGRWCEVDFLTYESTVARGVHVLGDAIQPGPQMPKSGHMANQQAKICAAAILDQLAGRPVNRKPVAANTCYSYVNAHEAMHVASVHVWDADHRSMVPVAGSGGLSAVHNAREGAYGQAWARNIWADAFM